MSKFKIGDSVKITEGKRRGWVPAMDKCIGECGVIMSTSACGDFLVRIDATTCWYFYPDSFVTNRFKGNK